MVDDSWWKTAWETICVFFISLGDFTAVVRWIIPVVAFFIVFRCVRSMLTGHEAPEIWAYLDVDGYDLMTMKAA